MNRQPLNITIVSHSDIIGDAAVAMMRLMRTLTDRGHNVSMLVFTKFTNLDNISTIKARSSARLFMFGLERLRILIGSGFRRDDLFKLSIANTGFDICDRPEIAGADIVILGWVNQGMMSLDHIRRLGQRKPLVWVMHDLWNMTGACHYPGTCTRYEQMCGHCPMLCNGRHERDLSRSTWWRKKQLYDRININFVAMSNYIADAARRSQLLQGRDVTVIHNTFDTDIFKPDRNRDNPYGLPRDKHIIVISAASLDSPVTDLGAAIDALNHIFDNHPLLTNECEAVFVGDLRDSSPLDELRFPSRHIGPVHDLTALADIYSRADVLLSTARCGTHDITLLEGMATGATPVAPGRKDISDIIRHKVNGYVATPGDPADIAGGICWALDARLDRQMLHEDAVNRFAPEIMAGSFEALFDDIITRRRRPDAPAQTLADLDRHIMAEAAKALS